MIAVKFLNKQSLLDLDPQEVVRRAKLQDEINNQRATILNEANRTEFPRYYGVIYFQRFYELRRKEMRIVPRRFLLIDSVKITQNI